MDFNNNFQQDSFPVSLQTGRLDEGVPTIMPMKATVVGLGEPDQELSIREGQSVFKVGDIPRGIYFLKSGAIKLVTERPQSRGRMGNAEFINKIVGPGEFFGLKSLIKGTALPFYAKALRNSEIQVYSPVVLRQMMASGNNLMKMVMEQLASDLESHEKTSQLHYLASVQERISYQLVLLAEKFGIASADGIVLNLRLTRNELAQLAGTINESLSRHLTELKNEGIIDVHGKEIVVKNLLALKEKSGNFHTKKTDS